MKSSATFLIGLFSAVLTLSPVVAEPIDPANPPAGLFSDEWQVLFLSGQKVGYTHATMTREEGIIRSHSKTFLRLGRIDQPVEMTMVESATESLAGGLISFESVQELAKMKMVSRGVVADGMVTLTKSQFGVENVRKTAYPKGAIYKSWGLFRESMSRGFEPGLAYDLAIYEPSLREDGAVTASTVIGNWEQIEHEGQLRRAQKVTVEMASPIGSLTMVSWVNPDGVPLKSVLPMPGLGDMVVISSDQATALADFVAPELFMTTTVKVDRSLDAGRLKRVKYRLGLKGAEANGVDFPQTDMQRVVDRSKDWIDLEVVRPDMKAIGNAPAPGSEYLEPNLMINTADPKLKALAVLAAGGETDPAKLAGKLREFVTDYVTDKNLGIGFATASEVCRNREGDCSEHGVLLAALGRFCGIPSRVVVGLVYVPRLGGEENVFGYHMWTQFFIQGRWKDVDAAMRETDVSPAHIVFATSSLRESGLSDLSFGMLDKMGAISIQILETEPK